MAGHKHVSRKRQLTTTGAMNLTTTLVLMYFILGTITMTLIYTTGMYYKERFQQSDPMLFTIRENLMLLSPKASRLKFYQDNKSYTINKQKVYLCLKDDNDQYYPMNMLMYVAIHELAHVLCDEIGHTPKFHKIFTELLKNAEKTGIYDPNIPVIQNYCGYNKETFVLSFEKPQRSSV
jgi:hypothetical protein